MRMALKYAKKLEEAGFTKRQVQVSYEILDKTLGDIATKKDIQTAIENLQKDIRHQFGLMESKLTIRLGLMIFACFSAIKVFDKVFDKFF